MNTEEQRMTREEFRRRNRNIILGTIGGFALSLAGGTGFGVYHKSNAPTKPQGYTEYVDSRREISSLENVRSELNSLLNRMPKLGLEGSVAKIDEQIIKARQDMGQTARIPEFQRYEADYREHNNPIYPMGMGAIAAAGIVAFGLLGLSRQRKLDKEYGRETQK